MVKRIAALAIVSLFSMTTFAMARDTLLQFSVEDAMNNPKVKNELEQSVKLYWGDQKHPKEQSVFGEYKTSQRTNAFGKSKEEACQWALAASIKQLQTRALREGGNAVINIKSNVKNMEKSSQSEFDCLAGAMMVNVALKGTVVKLAE